MHRKQIKDANHIKDYIFAGNATFTVVSGKTGTRFTYKISRAKGDNDDRPYFVMVLTGSNNEGDYTYAGFIPADDLTKIIRGRKGRLDSKAPSIVALSWVLRAAAQKPEALANIEFWHEGKCGACGRKLTVPESIDSGLGPVCAGRSASLPEDIATKSAEQDAERKADAAAEMAAMEDEDLRQQQADEDLEVAKEIRKCEYLAAVGDQEAIDILEYYKQRSA